MKIFREGSGYVLKKKLEVEGGGGPLSSVQVMPSLPCKDLGAKITEFLVRAVKRP